MKRIPALILTGAFLILSYSVAVAQTNAAPSTAGAGSPSAAATTPAAAPADPLAGYSAASAACRVALQKAVAFRAEGKWRSAYDVLAAFDPDNKDPYALAMKTRLCLDGLVQTEQFQSFALKDLAKGETLAAARQNGGEGAVPFAFDPAALAASLSAAGAKLPPVLAKVLGDYYYLGQAEFAKHWVMSDEDAYQKSLEQYQAAYAGGVYDADSLQNMAELLMRTGQSAEAAPIFQKSLALNPSNPTAHYNYAVCLIQQGNFKPALDQLDLAAELFQEPQAKFQTYSIAARTASQFGDAARSEAYIKKIEVLDPQGPNANLLRHELAVGRKDQAAANAAADALMAHFADNPGVVRALVSVWYENDGAAEARAFLDRTIAKTQDDKSLGTLQFYLALLLVQGKPSDADKTAALAALDQSAAHMKKVLPPDSEFFGIVEQVRGHITGQTAPGAAGPAQSAAPAGTDSSSAAAAAGAAPSSGSASSNGTQGSAASPAKQ
ncbi:MAG: tetratricopeptide repeat protein [Treponema sp.]|nr:tetratricopeptide repeat protein [Treponema sp.]